MVTLNEYRSLDEFDNKRRKALEALLYTDETFIYGIDVYDAIFFASSRASKLVLTDRRVIVFKKGFIKETSKDYGLDDIASIEYDKGYVMRRISLEGSGISNDYQTLEGYGQTFVTAVREQTARNSEGREPIDTPTAEGGTGGQTGVESVPNKYGSIKWHVGIFILTFWTGGLANLAYAGYSYYQFNQTVSGENSV